MPVYIVAKSIANVIWCWLICWLMLTDTDWLCLLLLDADWFRLMLISADWCCEMLIDADWCSNKVQAGFLLSECTSGATPIIFWSAILIFVHSIDYPTKTTKSGWAETKYLTVGDWVRLWVNVWTLETGLRLLLFLCSSRYQNCKGQSEVLKW